MFLSDFSIKRPIATIVLIIAMMCLGLLALSKLRVNQNPDVEVPFIIVNIRGIRFARRAGRSRKTGHNALILRLRHDSQQSA